MTRPESGEGELIELAKAGDLDAFEAIVAMHSDRVYRSLRRFGLDRDEAEEVAQDVFIRAWRGLERFEGRAQLSTWLYRIAFNEAQRRLARRRPAPVPPGATTEQALEDLPEPDTAGPEAASLDREFTATLRQALAELPQELRAAVVLRDLEGLSTEEAADVVGVGQAAFKSRLHRGRTALRMLLEPYLDLQLG